MSASDSFLPPLKTAYTRPQNFTPKLDWVELLRFSLEKEATDILFSRGRIYMRINRDVTLYEAWAPDADEYRDTLLAMCPSDHNIDEINGSDGAADFAITVGERRLRANVFTDIHGLNAALRPLPLGVYSMEKLGLSPKVVNVVTQSKAGGLILVTGPTGSGKSTTIQALIEHLNVTGAFNIITIEDPVEFVFTPAKSIIAQREVGGQVGSFDRALRSAMRENPDIIVIGEVRDYATVKAAMQAAETGHLVFATLHTKRVYSTVSRIVEMAPSAEKGDLRNLLANNLIMVMCQRLIKRQMGGIVACREIMIQNVAGANAIRSEREKELTNIMLTNRKEGMVDWETALEELVKGGFVSATEAAKYK